MMKKALLLGASGAVLLLSGCVGTLPPVQNPNAVAVSASPAVMKAAITSAADLRQWRIVEEKPGLVRLAYPGTAKAEHFEMIADVEYTKKGYSVEYVSSRGLDAGPCKDNPKQTCIHRNVNKWLQNLSSDILRSIR